MSQVENLNSPTGKQTEYLLHKIAERLSGRDDCRETEYEVTIDYSGVRMYPLIEIFPNRYKRQQSDKLDVVSFVHMNYMKGTQLSDFVFGTYRYEFSELSKKRRWVRLR